FPVRHETETGDEGLETWILAEQSHIRPPKNSEGNPHWCQNSASCDSESPGRPVLAICTTSPNHINSDVLHRPIQPAADCGQMAYSTLVYPFGQLCSDPSLDLVLDLIFVVRPALATNQRVGELGVREIPPAGLSALGRVLRCHKSHRETSEMPDLCPL